MCRGLALIMQPRGSGQGILPPQTNTPEGGRDVRSGVKTGKAHREHMFSALPPRTDIERPVRHVRFVPTTDSCAAANGISIRSPRRSARAVSAKGRPPTAFKVLRLMINSNLFGNSTAGSPGVAPLRIFTT